MSLLEKIFELYKNMIMEYEYNRVNNIVAFCLMFIITIIILVVMIFLYLLLVVLLGKIGLPYQRLFAFGICFVIGMLILISKLMEGRNAKKTKKES